MAELNLTVLPGEQLLVAVFKYASTVRETMSQANRDRFDNINISLLEDFRGLWTRIASIDKKE